MTQWPVHGTITGPIVMIGFGSIGKGTLPLIERHFTYDAKRVTVIDPEDKDRGILDERGIRFIKEKVTRDNIEDLLRPLLSEGGGQPFIVNLSVEVSSVAIMRLANETGALYVDTVAEPWPGFYGDASLSVSQRSNYALREGVLDLKRELGPHGPTAVNCCGANPGMVSWFVKQALLNVAADTGHRRPPSRNPGKSLGCGWRTKPGCERHPYRRARYPARQDPEADAASSSTPGRWKASCRRGCSRPNSVGAPTRKGMPPEGKQPRFRPRLCAIYLMRPGAGTRVRSWTPDGAAPSTAFSSPTTRQYRSPTTSPCGKTAPCCTGRPATTPIASGRRRGTVAATRWRGTGNGSSSPTRHILDRGRDRRRHRRTGRPALRARQERLLVRLAALDRGNPAASRPTRTRPACR